MYSGAAGHTCSETCYHLPCPLPTNTTAQLAAEHTFTKIILWPYHITRVSGRRNSKKPFCSWVVEFTNPTQLTDAQMKKEFDRIARISPMNAETFRRSVNASGTMELEYKVRCGCRKPDFRLVPTRPVIELANKRTQKPEELIATLRLDYDEKRTHPKCIPFERLTVESSLFWRSLIEFFRDEGLSDYLRSITPELSTFCDYVEKYNDTMTTGEEKEEAVARSVLFNLIEILVNFDYGNEIGRQRLRILAVHLLTTNPCNEHSIRTLIEICEKLLPNYDDRLNMLDDIIRRLIDTELFAEALNHMDRNVDEAIENQPNLMKQVSTLKLKLCELKVDENEFVKIKNYVSLSRVVEEAALYQNILTSLLKPLMPRDSWNSLHQKRITKEKQIKALMMTFYGICSKDMKTLNPTLYQLYTDFIRVKMESSDMDVRILALKCGATFSVLNEEWAKDTFSILNKQFFDHHHTAVWTTSVAAMFQLLDRYGLSYFDVDPSGKKRKEKPEKILSQCNSSECTNSLDDDSYIAGDVTIKRLIHLFGLSTDICGDVNLMRAFIDGFELLSLRECMSMSDWQFARNRSMNGRNDLTIKHE